MSYTAFTPQDFSDRPRRPAGLRRRTKVLLTALILVVLLVVASLLIKVPYVILKPGPAPNTLGSFEGEKVLTISGAKTYPTTGSLHFTTVSMYGGPGNQPSLLEYLFAQTQDNVEIYKQNDLFPPETTSDQVQQQNQRDMTSSQESAEVVAAREAGYTVPETVKIGDIDPKATQAVKLLRTGDVIVGVNGAPASTTPTLAAAMKKVKPGQSVKLTVKRDGQEKTFTMPTHDADGRAVMGLLLDPETKMPFKVKVSVGDVGGPSAGLMFTLAIYDQITPGPLTGGKNIAGTGTVSSDGTVGPIGGIPEKVVGAKDNGAKFFLSPADNCGELKGKVPSGIKVFKVNTVSDAIKTVDGIAHDKTNGLATCG